MKHETNVLHGYESPQVSYSQTMYSKLLKKYPISMLRRVKEMCSQVFVLLLCCQFTDQTPDSYPSSVRGDVSMGSAKDYSHGDELFPKMSMHLSSKMNFE